MKPGTEHYRKFYLVQRIYPSPKKNYEKALGGAFTHNPFGYGRLGDYELDYMGSAEFEWGAIPDSLKRFAEAHDKNGVIRLEWKVPESWSDNTLVIAYLEQDGDPTETLTKWVEDEKCDGKEPARDFYQLVTGVEPSRYSRPTKVWWSLNDDVMFSFMEKDESGNSFSHLGLMLESMTADTNRVRDFSKGQR